MIKLIIPNEEYLPSYQEAYDEYLADQKKSRPINELWKECGI